MRNDEPFLPQLDWKPRRGAQQIYEVIVDGKSACIIQIARLADLTSVWRWNVDTSMIKAHATHINATGEERTARLAVRRAEEAYHRLFSDK